MSYHFGNLVVGFIVLSSFLLGACATNLKPVETITQTQIIPSKTPTLSPTRIPLPPATSSPTALPVKAPTQGTPSLSSPLSNFPLNLGNSWVYSSTHYDAYETERITATYTITETVVDTQIDNAYYIVQMLRDNTVVTSSVNLAELEQTDLYLDGTGGTETYWYIINGTDIYLQQNELNLETVESSWLEYTLPISENSAWYPDPYQRNTFSVESGPISGLRLARGPTQKSVPAGEFENCFEILTIYLSGGTTSWFCQGLGVVAGEYDHAGTPFGYRTVLITYSIRSP